MTDQPSLTITPHQLRAAVAAVLRHAVYSTARPTNAAMDGLTTVAWDALEVQATTDVAASGFTMSPRQCVRHEPHEAHEWLMSNDLTTGWECPGITAPATDLDTGALVKSIIDQVDGDVIVFGGREWHVDGDNPQDHALLRIGEVVDPGEHAAGYAVRLTATAEPLT